MCSIDTDRAQHQITGDTERTVCAIDDLDYIDHNSLDDDITEV